MTALALLEEVRSFGVEIRPDGDDLVIRPASKIPLELKERLRVQKTEVLAVLKGRPATGYQSAHIDPAPDKPCYACGSRTFWRSVHGAVICWRCHPPANEGLVADILWDGEVKCHMWVN